jgi:hypothetical protein
MTCRAIRKIRAVHIITAPSIRAPCTRLQNAHRIPPPSGLPTQAPNLRTPSLYPLYSLQPPANRAPRPSTLAPVRNLRTASIRPPRAPCTRLQAAHVIPSPSSLHSCFLPPPPASGTCAHAAHTLPTLLPAPSTINQPHASCAHAANTLPRASWLQPPVGKRRAHPPCISPAPATCARALSASSQLVIPLRKLRIPSLLPSISCHLRPHPPSSSHLCANCANHSRYQPAPMHAYFFECNAMQWLQPSDMKTTYKSKLNPLT